MSELSFARYLHFDLEISLARFGPDVAQMMRERKELDPDLSKKEIREHPELPGNKAVSVKMIHSNSFFSHAHIRDRLESLFAICSGSSAVPLLSGGFGGG